jgi:hypothetical protein
VGARGSAANDAAARGPPYKPRTRSQPTRALTISFTTLQQKQSRHGDRSQPSGRDSRGAGGATREADNVCLIGSSPGIVSGQPDRQSLDIDVWRQRSTYDEAELRKACQDLQLLFDPKEELDPDAVYVQIVRPGVVRLPANFAVEILGQYGNLTVVMPEPALLSAAKLVRGDPRDIEDVAWWVKDRALSLDEIRIAAESLPDLSQREAAGANMVLVELIVAGERKPK